MIHLDFNVLKFCSAKSRDLLLNSELFKCREGVLLYFCVRKVYENEKEKSGCVFPRIGASTADRTGAFATSFINTCRGKCGARGCAFDVTPTTFAVRCALQRDGKKASVHVCKLICGRRSVNSASRRAVQSKWKRADAFARM